MYFFANQIKKQVCISTENMSQMRTRCVSQAGQISDTIAEHKGNWLSVPLISADTTKIFLTLKKI